MDLDTLLKHTSRSLYLSAKMLPAKICPAFGLAYLLCRYADSIADTDLIPSEKRLSWVEQFPQLIRTADVHMQTELVRDLTGSSENPYEKELITHLADCLQALQSIQSDLIPYIYEVVQAVCDGMRLDLTTFNGTTLSAFKTEQDLTHYCRLMGGKPGLFWSQLIYQTCRVKLPKEHFFTLGQQVGDALQIVNILRDLPRDLQNKRCYFPLEHLQKQGLSAADLLTPANTPQFEPIKRYWLTWGKQNLQQAIAFFSALPKTEIRTRAAVAWPILWTADTFNKLAACPDLLNPQKRVKIPRVTVYFTLFITPLLLMSNTFFATWLTRKLNKLSRAL